MIPSPPWKKCAEMAKEKNGTFFVFWKKDFAAFGSEARR